MLHTQMLTLLFLLMLLTQTTLGRNLQREKPRKKLLTLKLLLLKKLLLKKLLPLKLLPLKLLQLQHQLVTKILAPCEIKKGLLLREWPFLFVICTSHG
jgi:hypothetical protein